MIRRQLSRSLSIASLSLLAGVGCQRATASEQNAPAAAGGGGATSTRITISGSSALVELAQEAATRYMRAHPNVTVEVSAGGSLHGLAQVTANAVTIGDSDAFATPEQAPQLEDHRIAVVGFAAMANKGAFNSSVTSLTQDQMRAIFTGQTTNWSAVGGSDQPLTVINRTRTSGTRAVFGNIVLGGDHFVEGVAEQENSGQLQSMLLQQVGSISYFGLSYANPNVQVLSYNGVAPTAENIQAGTYPIWSYEHMYTRGPATGETRAFLDFVMSPAFQADALPAMHFIQVARMRVSRDHD